MTRFKLVGFVPGLGSSSVSSAATYLRGTAFSLSAQIAAREVDRPSAGTGTRKTSQRGRQEPLYNDASCLGFLAQ